MSCGHEHGEHGGHGGHGHDDDDDHVKGGEGTLDFLYTRIDRDGVVALNEARPGSGARIIKPWDQRMDEEQYLESDADDQLLIRVPFSGNVKLRSILLKAGPAGHTPESMKVFSNVESLDFDDAQDATPTQSFDSIAVTRECVEYSVRPAKFPNVRSLTFFVPRSMGEETTRIYFLGFRGEFSELKREGPTNIIYEAAPQLKDHARIPGTDGGFSNLGSGN